MFSKSHFKQKLNYDEYRALTGMLLNCDVLAIDDVMVREMLILILGSVVKRMVTKLENRTELVTLKLKRGEAAALQYVLNRITMDGYLMLVRNDMIYKLHLFFDNQNQPTP